MKNRFIKIFFLFAIIVVLTSQTLAWDDTGHKLIAYIAWEQMTSQAREAAVKTLLSAPEDSDLSVFYSSDSRSAAAKQRELFMIAATWSDIVRNKDFSVRYAKYHHGNWHYLDTFWHNVNGKVELVPGLESDRENALERLFFFDKVLRNTSVASADKAIALAWILHLGGDIHQPLHASGRVTDLEPKGDQGGNLFELSPKDAPRENQLNLHWFWDSIVGRNVPRKNDECDSDYIPSIARQMTEKYPFAKMSNRLKLGKFDEWQQESFRIASTEVYPPTLKRFEMPSEAYKKLAFQIAEEQIALAGYRLGEMLNQIFDSRELTREQYEKDKFKYQSQDSGSKIGQGVNDAWIWTKTRATLAVMNELRNSTINVDVENSIVTLRGTVPSKEQKEKALKEVKNIEGVKAVKDMLKISPSDVK